MAEPLIRYKNVEVHQQDLCVLNEVNLELQKGEFVYLIGKVGSGKTSLLKTLYGELDITADRKSTRLNSSHPSSSRMPSSA